MDLDPIDLTDAESERDKKKEDKKFFLRYWIFFGGVAFIVIALFIRMLINAPVIKTETIADKNFTANASTVCKGYMKKLREQQLKKNEHLTNAKLAKRVRQSTSTMNDMVDELRALTVSPSDQPAVKRWFVEWDKYIDAGNRYAASVTSDDRSQWEKIGKESTTYSRNVTAFSLNNKIDDCALVTQAPQRSSAF